MKPRYRLLFVVVVIALHMVRFGMIFPFVPLLAEKMGASPAMIGLVSGSYFFLAIFLAVPIGGLTDRLGIKYTLAVGVVLSVVQALLLYAARDIVTVIIAQLAGGVSHQLHVVSSQSYISKFTDVGMREKGFGYHAFGASLGQAVGPIVSGFLISGYGYKGAFLAVLILALLGAGVIFIPEPPTLTGEERRGFREDLFEAGRLLGNKRMVSVLTFVFVVICAVSLRGSFLPVYLGTLELSEADIGVLISVFAAASTTVRYFIGVIMSLMKRRWVLLISTILLSAGLGTVPVLSQPLLLAVSIGVLGIGFGFTQPLTMIMAADLAANGRSGLTMGLRYTILTSGNLLGPLIYGYVVEGLHLTSSFYIAAMSVAAAGFFLCLVRPQLIPERD